MGLINDNINIVASRGHEFLVWGVVVAYLCAGLCALILRPRTPKETKAVEHESDEAEEYEPFEQALAKATHLHKKPPSKRDAACCGIGFGNASALPVDSFAVALQRLVIKCKQKQENKPVRIFDDCTVSESVDGVAMSLTECRCRYFRRVREAAGLSEDKYFGEVCLNPFSSGTVEASGKSGQAFFRTHRKHFVLKTVDEHEFEALKETLPAYVLYMEENRNSLICRIFGSYSLQIGGQTLRFVAMANVLPHPALEVYDLKGTTEDRWVNPASGGCLKDSNFADQNMMFEPNVCERLRQQIRDDADFLLSIGVMDYSLLVGVSSRADVRRYASQHGVLEGWLNCQGEKIERMFQLGIIDYLQRWTPKKKLQPIGLRNRP